MRGLKNGQAPLMPTSPGREGAAVAPARSAMLLVCVFLLGCGGTAWFLTLATPVARVVGPPVATRQPIPHQQQAAPVLSRRDLNDHARESSAPTCF